MDVQKINEIFRKNLSYYLEKREHTQLELAKYMDVSNTTVNNWVKGYSLPRMDKIDRICEFLKITRSDLLEEKDPLRAVTPVAAKKIPVLGRVAAGLPLYAAEEIIDYEEIPLSLAKTGEYFGLQIKGNSMTPRICEGDVVIVRKQEDVDTGDIAIVMINGDEATCKQIHKTAAGLMLVAFNPLFAPLLFTPTQIKDLPVSIIGKVIELRGKL